MLGLGNQRSKAFLCGAPRENSYVFLSAVNRGAFHDHSSKCNFSRAHVNSLDTFKQVSLAIVFLEISRLSTSLSATTALSTSCTVNLIITFKFFFQLSLCFLYIFVFLCYSYSLIFQQSVFLRMLLDSRLVFFWLVLLGGERHVHGYYHK